MAEHCFLGEGGLFIYFLFFYFFLYFFFGGGGLGEGEPIWPRLRREAGKQKDLGSILLRFSILFKNCLWFVDTLL